MPIFQRALLTAICCGALVTPANAFVRGDANGDQAIDISDPVAILQVLFTPGSAPLSCTDAGDTNDDGSFDISDAVFLLSHLFIPGSPPPPEPFPLSGADPTPDALGDCDATSLPFVVAVESFVCGAPDTFEIFREAADFEVFWSQYASIFFPPPPQPVVDFSNEMVVAIVQNHSTGGFFISIDELIATGGDIEVHFTAGSPLGGCPVTTATTAPHSIVITPLAPGDPVALSTVVDTCP